jgi:CPA1 family monovalent cation:H+ antiporter
MMSGSIDASGATLDALRVFAVSIIVGIVIGYLFYILMKLFNDKRGEFFAFVVEAYLAYVLGESMHVSGILLLITSIIATKAWIDIDIESENIVQTTSKSRNFLRNIRLGHLKATTTERLEYIYEMAKEFGYIAAVMIFFVLAEMVDVDKLWHYRYEILIMFAATTLIRALSMAKFALFGKKFSLIKPVGFEGWFVLTFSGMKGALSVILVHMIPDSFEYKDMFESITIGVVILSIFVYGSVLWFYFTFKPKEKVKSIFKKLQ